LTTNSKEWIVTGFHEKHQKLGTYIYSNANPMEYKMSLWGKKFSFNEEGYVYDKEFGRIVSK